MSESTPAAIAVSHLVKAFGGSPAVSDISFTVPQGEILGFLGPNGAGKSTTMRILTGYLAATSGRVEICGFSVASKAEEVKRRVGYMPENNPLPEDMRLSEYLYFRGRLKEVPRRKLGPRIDEVLEVCDLKRVRHKIIGQLSKGFRQRIGIAEAILAEPPIIIMDEPTIGLDPHQILIVRDLIASLRGRMTVLISSHILPEIEVTCDRVLIINQGRVVAQGTPEALRREILGRNSYSVEFSGEPAKLEAAATAVPGCEVSSLGEAGPDGFRRAMLCTEDERELGEPLIAACLERGLRLRSISRAHPTLEDVFLAATRRSWDLVQPRRADEGAPPS
ncbi:MAG TPA: ABC transporter ATP-binding protein [Opitutaceae bacterium]|jgi:ABC-2 type transport system ATP-binding protein